MSVVRSLVTIWAFCAASIALQWAPTPKDGSIIYACVGDDVTFPWSYTTLPGEEITSVEWLFDGSSQEMMAFLSHGAFVPLPAFSGRVQQTANGGITLSHVTAGDVGNYTVEINLRGSAAIQRRTLKLQVISGVPTLDGHLHALQQQVAVLDSATQQWSLVLSCGRFAFLGQPVFPVEWLTPSDQVVPSTDYTDGYFNLHLSNPVEGGTYRCRIPRDHLASACLHANQSAAGEASVEVDKVDARMALMEAELKALRQEKQHLQQLVTDLTNNVTGAVHLVSNVDDRLSLLELTHSRDNATLTRLIQDTKTPLVGFNVQTQIDHHLNPPNHLKFENILYNAGQGYDNATGNFRAPVDGTYFFIFHTQSSSTFSAYSYMYVNGREICRCYIYNNYDHGSCHAVVHLVKGDAVWIEPFVPNMYYTEHTTSFAGFLFHADP